MIKTPALELRDLHKSYGALEVLKGISFSAQYGEAVSLISSSGSGKSTLLRFTNLLEFSQAGDVLVDGSMTPIRMSNVLHQSQRVVDSRMCVARRNCVTNTEELEVSI